MIRLSNKESRLIMTWKSIQKHQSHNSIWKTKLAEFNLDHKGLKEVDKLVNENNNTLEMVTYKLFFKFTIKEYFFNIYLKQFLFINGFNSCKTFEWSKLSNKNKCFFKLNNIFLGIVPNNKPSLVAFIWTIWTSFLIF